MPLFNIIACVRHCARCLRWRNQSDTKPVHKHITVWQAEKPTSVPWHSSISTLTKPSPENKGKESLFNIPEKALEMPVEMHKGSWEETSVSSDEKCVHNCLKPHQTFEVHKRVPFSGRGGSKEGVARKAGRPQAAELLLTRTWHLAVILKLTRSVIEELWSRDGTRRRFSFKMTSRVKS